MSSKLFSFDTPPAREVFRVTIKSTLIAELAEMTEFAKETTGNQNVDVSQMLEFILEEAYFGKKHRKEIKAFRDWQKEKRGDAEVSKKSKKGKKEKKSENIASEVSESFEVSISEEIDDDIDAIINEELAEFENIELLDTSPTSLDESVSVAPTRVISR